MSANDFVISHQVYALINFILFFSFLQCYLSTTNCFQSSGKVVKTDVMKKTFSLKYISSCLLVAACVVVISIPLGVYIGLRINSTETRNTLDNAKLAGIWTITIALLNCTFNCLIFYWKNEVLRTEGLKVIKSMKIFRRLQS